MSIQRKFFVLYGTWSRFMVLMAFIPWWSMILDWSRCLLALIVFPTLMFDLSILLVLMMMFNNCFWPSYLLALIVVLIILDGLDDFLSLRIVSDRITLDVFNPTLISSDQSWCTFEVNHLVGIELENFKEIIFKMVFLCLINIFYH